MKTQPTPFDKGNTESSYGDYDTLFKNYDQLTQIMSNIRLHILYISF